MELWQVDITLIMLGFMIEYPNIMKVHGNTAEE